MNVNMKISLQLILIALMLVPLGFYNNIGQAKDKSEIRLDANFIEMVTRSEKEIKRNVTKLATLESGISIFRYQYQNDKTVYVGLMADDLAKNKLFKPYVVHMGEGHYAINYERLGLYPITLETWEKEGLAAMQSATNIASNKKDQTTDIK